MSVDVHPEKPPLESSPLSAIVVAGTHSGVGKTTITLGLIGALRRRGLIVQPFKVGPDFSRDMRSNAQTARTRNPADFRALAAFAYARSGGAGPNTSWFDEPCATWPATDVDGYFGPWDRPTANTLLVVGNTYDPSTWPKSWSGPGC